MFYGIEGAKFSKIFVFIQLVFLLSFEILNVGELVEMRRSLHQ